MAPDLGNLYSQPDSCRCSPCSEAEVDSGRIYIDYTRKLFLHLTRHVSAGATAAMAGNDPFQQKTSPQNRKMFITQPKHMIF